MAAQSSNELQLYDSWDLARPSITPRTRLYHLQPIGLGTPRTESLISYVARLASAHCLPVYILCDQEIAPKTNLEVTPGQGRRLSGKVTARDLTAINGKGRTTHEWVTRVERLTSQQRLSALTLLPWRAVLADKFLLRRVRAWCPDCLEDQKRNNTTIYEPLTWALTAVSACIEHSYNLQTKCPHCHRTCSPFGGKLIPGRCSRCLGWLGNVGSGTTREAATTYELWAANELGQLIAAGCTLTRPPTARRISNFLRACASNACDGNDAAFARFLGVEVDVYHNWQSMKRLPHINLMLRVCYRSSIGLVSLLTSDFIEPRFFSRLSTLVTSTTWHPREHRIETALLNALQEEPTPSVLDVAQRLGVARSSLYINHAELCRTLATKHRYTRNHRKLYEKVAARRTEYRIHQQNHLRNTLKLLLLDNPPPSLNEAAKRLGYKDYKLCKKTLLKYFPDLVAALKARLEEHRKFKRYRILKVLEEALCENPPPSREEVVGRTGYSSIHIWVTFPAQLEAIKARHHEFERHLTAERKAEAKSRIKEVALKLCAARIYPSADEIIKACNGRMGLRRVELTEVLREFRQEIGIKYSPSDHRLNWKH